jgi:hypothetical protein
LKVNLTKIKTFTKKTAVIKSFLKGYVGSLGKRYWFFKPDATLSFNRFQFILLRNAQQPLILVLKLLLRTVLIVFNSSYRRGERFNKQPVAVFSEQPAGARANQKKSPFFSSKAYLCIRF